MLKELCIPVLVVLASCNPVAISFAEYDGVNLIASHPLGGDWVPAHAGTNDFMTFEALSGAELSAAQARTGLPSAEAPVFRLEVRNQFANGDFQASPDTIATASDIGGGAMWVSSHAAAANDILWIEEDATNKILEFSNSGTSATLYADLTQTIQGFTANSEYTFYIDFYRNSALLASELLELPIRFGFDDGTGERNRAGEFISSLSVNDTRIRFPSSFFRRRNVIVINNSFNRLYFGFESGREFGAGIDNIRFLQQGDYSIALNIPWSEEGRPILRRGGVYRLSLYVASDPSVATTNNRFTASAIALELSGLQENSQTVIRNIEIDVNSETWQRVEISAENLFSSVPQSPNAPALRIAITASALGEAEGGESGMRVNLDAGSILIANPELYFAVE